MAGTNRFSFDYWMAKAFELYLKASVSPPAGVDHIPGYLHRLEGIFLHWLATRVPAGACIVEIGSFKGRSSCYIASGLRSPGARLHCVDVWRNQAMPYDPPEDVFPEFEANVAKYRHAIEAHRGESAEVASRWTLPIDVLFIDGDHSYEGCRPDIDSWLRHVRSGGWVVFHDSSQPGVERARAEKFPRRLRSHGIHVYSIFAARKR
jgi:predicted O-methyltransferase YrrM